MKINPSDIDLLDNIYEILDIPGKAQTHLQSRIIDLRFRMSCALLEQKEKENQD